MDLDRADYDFAAITQKGFDHIGLRVAWGSLYVLATFQNVSVADLLQDPAFYI